MSTLLYPWSEPPQAAEVIEVADGLFWLRMPLPFALDHINLWVLADGEGWTLLDCGICSDESKSLWETLTLELIGKRPVKRVIATHFHPDHLGLAGWLCDRSQAPLWMTRNEWFTGSLLYWDEKDRIPEQQVEFFKRHGLSIEWLDALKHNRLNYRHRLSAPPGSFHPIREGDVLTIGKYRWRVIVGLGHAPEHACLYSDELKVLIAGDQILPKITPNVAQNVYEPEANPLGMYLDSLRKFDTLPDDTLVLPSHGLPFRGLHGRTNYLKDHHIERCDEIVMACDQPMTAAEMVPILFKRKLDAHQIFFAMGESLSHLMYLTDQGKLRQIYDNEKTIRFAPVNH
ncbi:MBL fold metallo-hydrolase [Pseudomonadota bacterium]